MKVLFLIEHYDREYSAVLQLAQEIKKQTKSEVTIASLQFHLHILLRNNFDLIFVPFLFQRSDITYKLWNAWQRNAILINLNWEQNLFNINQSYKRLVGILPNENIYHVVWSQAHKKQFIEMGFFEERLVVVEQLNLLGQKQFFDDANDEKIARILNGRKLLFCALNYNWAFLSKRSVQNRIKKGFNADIAAAYRSFAEVNRNEFLCQIKKYAKENADIFIVLRPHPSISTENYYSIDTELKNIKNLLVTHEFTAWDWVRHASAIVSSWSTVAFDSHQLGKSSYLFLPYGVPSYLDCAFMREVPKLKSLQQIVYKECITHSKNLELDSRYVTKILSLSKVTSHQTLSIKFINLKSILWLIRSYIRFLCMRLHIPGIVSSGTVRDYFAIYKL